MMREILEDTMTMTMMMMIIEEEDDAEENLYFQNFLIFRKLILL